MQTLKAKMPSRLRVGNHRGGFTLVELLTVIAIISILAGFLMPVLGTAKNRAREAKAKSMIASLKMALSMYNTDYGVYPQSISMISGSVIQVNGNSRRADAFQNADTGTEHYNLVKSLAVTIGGGPYMEFTADDLDGSIGDAKPVLLDPWGRAYIYVSRKYWDGNSWENPAFTGWGPFHPYYNSPLTATELNKNTYNIYSLGRDGKTYKGVSYSDAGGDDWDLDTMYNDFEDGDADSYDQNQDNTQWLRDDINSWK